MPACFPQGDNQIATLLIQISQRQTFHTAFGSRAYLREFHQ
jgi:hypothetical protein